MKNKLKGYFDSSIGVLTLIALVYLFLEVVLHITCPIKFLTGISDAGCGMSRAWACFLRGDVRKAFYYHPLFWILIPDFAIYLSRKRIPAKRRKQVVIVNIVLFIGVWLYRFTIPNQNIVVFDPANGFIVKSIDHIAHLINRG